MNLKLIDKYQRKDPRLMAKYENCIYKTSSFCGGSNIHLNLITCEDKIVIMSILKTYVLHWYYMYLLHPGMYLYWPGIRKPARKELINCDTCQHKKRSNKNMENYQLRKLRKYHGTKSMYI